MNDRVPGIFQALGRLFHGLRVSYFTFLRNLANRCYQPKDRRGHYDMDGISFEIGKGVIVAGGEKSGSGKTLVLAPVKT